jgi:hypothetical protein
MGSPPKSQGAARSRLPNDLRTICAKRREISIRYAWNSYKNDGKISKSRMLTLVRLRELERLYTARQCLVDDDAGREYLEIAAHHIAQLRGEVAKHIVQWCQRWAPWMPAAEAAAMARRVADKPRKWKAASLGDELNLTPEERDALNISTFRPAGWTKRHLDKANKEKRRIRAHQRRQRIAAAEGKILRAKPGRPRKTAAGTNIRAHQGRVSGGHAFPPQAEPSGSAVTQQDVSVVSFRVKPDPEPTPAAQPEWKEAA